MRGVYALSTAAGSDFDWAVGGAWAAAFAAAVAAAVALVSFVGSVLQDRRSARRAALHDITTDELASARDLVGMAAHSGVRVSIPKLRQSTFVMLWAIHRMVAVPTRAYLPRARSEQQMLQRHLCLMVRAMERAGSAKDPRAYGNSANIAWPIIKRLGTAETRSRFKRAFPFVAD